MTVIYVSVIHDGVMYDCVIHDGPNKRSRGLRGKRRWGWGWQEKTDGWDHYPAQLWGPEQQPDVPLAVPCHPWAGRWAVSKACRSSLGKARILLVMLLGCSGSRSRGPLPPPLFLADLGQPWVSTTRRASLHHLELPNAPGCVSSHYSLGAF